MPSRFAWLTLLLAGTLCSACGERDKDDGASFNAAMDAVFAAVDTRCEEVMQCYAALYEDGHGCWIPTGGPGDQARRGWIPASPQERESAYACMKPVYDNHPDELLEYLRCDEMAIKVIATCLDQQSCPTNAAECGRRSDDAKQACEKAADPGMLELLEQSCPAPEEGAS